MSRPQRNVPTACIGLFADRGNTAAAGSPTARTTSPSGASATTEPVWRLSTNPDRTTSANTGRGTMGSLVSQPIPRRGAGQRRRPHHRSSGGDLRTALVHDLPRGAGWRRPALRPTKSRASRPGPHRCAVPGRRSACRRPTRRRTGRARRTGRVHRAASTEPATNAPTAFGQDLRQLLDDAAGFTGAAALLGPQDVDPAVDQAAGVGSVGLLLLGLVAQGAARPAADSACRPGSSRRAPGRCAVFPRLDLHAELPPLAPPACAGTTVHHTGYRP
jgi:hypothetical protein